MNWKRSATVNLAPTPPGASARVARSGCPRTQKDVCPMKRLVFAIFAVAVVALPACAQSVSTVADVPFAFVAGNTTMPAGQYRIDAPAESLIVSLAGPGQSTHVLVSNPDDARSSADKPELIFHRYGDQYFLSAIRTPFRSREFPMSRLEVEVQKTASAKRASDLIVLAMR